MTAQIDIPGYSMVNKIAEGGMAEVWKARQEKLDRVVAIKVLHKQPETDKQEYARFIYEARAAATLIHPNVVQVIDAGEFDQFLYYVMEYVPGPTAGEVVDQDGAMPESRVLNIATEVAEALQYAWRDHKVVHCDIKPDNLLLHRNGRTKIADLGLAQVLGKDGVGIDEDMTLGTPNYFPPEQALVEEPLDSRTDMYALGATMYHLATGVVPFADLTPDDVASEQVHGQLPNPKEVNPRLTWGFCCLVERLMAKQTDDRYAEWTEVIADIQSVRDGKLIRDPLSEEIRSTVMHTRLPASLEKSQKIMNRRLAATRSVRLETGNQRPLEVHVNATSMARVRQQQKAVLTPPETIWPQVIGLGVLAAMMYAWTFFK
ncbi:MAG: serine/threonine-protein kinase [Kiritimatiellae bacterium]|jgi:serine/threonine protein kinase|nr:serine/threonine-protein kinase [Kiritimatiellia bacterium]